MSFRLEASPRNSPHDEYRLNVRLAPVAALNQGCGSEGKWGVSTSNALFKGPRTLDSLKMVYSQKLCNFQTSGPGLLGGLSKSRRNIREMLGWMSLVSWVNVYPNLSLDNWKRRVFGWYLAFPPPRAPLRPLGLKSARIVPEPILNSSPFGKRAGGRLAM